MDIKHGRYTRSIECKIHNITLLMVTRNHKMGSMSTDHHETFLSPKLRAVNKLECIDKLFCGGQQLLFAKCSDQFK